MQNADALLTAAFKAWDKTLADYNHIGFHHFMFGVLVFFGFLSLVSSSLWPLVYIIAAVLVSMVAGYAINFAEIVRDDDGR